MNKNQMLILIGGPSGAGKGLLAEKLSDKLEGITIVPTDNYCRKTEKPINFASPDTFNKDKFLQDLETLKSGKSIKYPNHLHPDNNAFYDGDSKEVAEKMGKEFIAKPAKIIIAEGYHGLQCQELRDRSDLKIYVTADPDNLLMWKIMRGPWYKKLEGKEAKDPRSYGKNIVESFDRWINSTRISSKKYVEPTKELADLVLINNTEKDLNDNEKKVRDYINLYFKNKKEFQNQLEKAKKEAKESNFSTREREREREHMKATVSLFSLCWWNGHCFIRIRSLLNI